MTQHLISEYRSTSGKSDLCEWEYSVLQYRLHLRTLRSTVQTEISDMRGDPFPFPLFERDQRPRPGHLRL
jgi:hypothetical protein